MNNNLIRTSMSIAGTAALGMVLLAGPASAMPAPDNGGGTVTTTQGDRVRSALSDLRVTDDAATAGALAPAASADDWTDSIPAAGLGIAGAAGVALLGAGIVRHRHHETPTGGAHPA